MSHSSNIIVRKANPGDRDQLDRLAALDSGRPIRGAALVAEADARILAALPLGAGRPIADPFEPTAQIIAFLSSAPGSSATPAMPARVLPTPFPDCFAYPPAPWAVPRPSRVAPPLP